MLSLCISFSVFADQSLLVKKGCYDDLNEFFDLEKYVVANPVDVSLINLLDGDEYELWQVTTNNLNTLKEIKSVGVKCGYSGGHIYKGKDRFVRGLSFIQSEVTPSDFIVKYHLDEDTYYVFIDSDSR